MSPRNIVSTSWSGFFRRELHAARVEGMTLPASAVGLKKEMSLQTKRLEKMVKDQADFLKNLNSVSYFSGEPNIPYVDFKSVIQNVARKRKQRHFLSKWNNFILNTTSQPKGNCKKEDFEETVYKENGQVISKELTSHEPIPESSFLNQELNPLNTLSVINYTSQGRNYSVDKENLICNNNETSYKKSGYSSPYIVPSMSPKKFEEHNNFYGLEEDQFSYPKFLEIHNRPIWAKESEILACRMFGSPGGKIEEQPKKRILKKDELNETLSTRTLEEAVSIDSKEQPSIKNIHHETSVELDTEKESIPGVIVKKIKEIPGVDMELKKIEEMRLKISLTLTSIKGLISKNHLVSSDTTQEDLERIKLRTQEFGARFNRNYCYRTKCQIDDLKIIDVNPLLIKKKSKIVAVIQKLSAAHNSVFQGLQVIEKQLQTISLSGLIQEVFFSFYNLIYELSFMLKPFYGIMKSKVLDDAEKIVLETIKLLKELKQAQDMSKTKKQNKCEKKKNIPKQKKGLKPILPNFALLKKKSPYANKLVKKGSTHTVVKEDKKKVDEINEVKPLKNIREESLESNLTLRKIEKKSYLGDPKTMVQILAENEMQNEGSKSTLKEPSSSDSNLVEVPDFSENKIPESPVAQKTSPNVKLVTIVRLDNENEAASNLPKNTSENRQMWDDFVEYKEGFQNYKHLNPLYNKKSLQTISSLTDKLMDEALEDSLKRVLDKVGVSDLAAFHVILEQEIK